MDRLGPRHRRGSLPRTVCTAPVLAALLLTVTTPGIADAPTLAVHRLDCGDFRSAATAREWFRLHRTLAVPNPWGMDGDGDGVAC